ncbi:MAG: DedA family protein [Janthinobacterium lividum]
MLHLVGAQLPSTGHLRNAGLLDPASHAHSSWFLALIVLLAAVLVGAILPVIPTGAAVSAMAALALHRSVLSLVEVLVVGAVAAYVGDVVLYALLHSSETRVSRFLHRRSSLGKAADYIQDLGERLARHDVRTLLTSRLLPGARVPVMIAAASTKYPVHRFAVANVVPALSWALAYAAIGLAGRSVSERPWVGVLVAIGFGIVASALVSLVQRRRGNR